MVPVRDGTKLSFVLPRGVTRRAETAVRHLAWLALFLILWPGFAVFAAVPPASALPVVTNVSGTVVVRSANGVSRDVISTRIMHPGDTLVTGVDSLALVSLADTGSVRLGPGSTASAASTASTLSLDLSSGSVCAQALSTGVSVQSGGLSLAAADNTSIFSLIRDANNTTIAVYQGQVTASIGGKTPWTFAAGDAAVSSNGGNPVKVPIESVQPQFAALHCPDEALINRVVPSPAPGASAASHSSGGGLWAILLGIGVIAAAAGHGGGAGGGNTNTGPPPSTPTPGPGTIALSTSSLSFALDGGPQTFNASESNYGGPLAAKSSDDTIATVSPASGTSPVTFTVTPVGKGSTTITISDNHGGSEKVTVSVAAPGTLIVTPPNLTFTVGAASQSINASESGYAGKIHAKTGDPTVATVSPASGSGPSTSFTVTPTGGGTTTIVVTDDHGGSQTVGITVAGPLSAAPSSLSFVGTTTAQNFNASDPLYTGIISASIDHPGVASVTPVGSTTGPNVKFSVTPLAAGSATITISDSLGASTSVTVTVSTGSLTVNPPTLTFTVGGAPQTFNASEADYSGLISATSSNTARATVSPASGSGPSVNFTVTPTASTGKDTTIGVSDTHGGLVFVDISITGPLTPTPSSLTFAGTTAPQTITVSDPNYFGSISASSTNPGVATVSSPSTGPSGVFTVTPVSMGSTTINFADANSGTTSATVTVTAGPLIVSTSSVVITSAGGTAPFTASETDYTGLISASSDNSAIASVSPASGGGPGPVPFTITAGSTAGSTTVHVTDDHGGSQPIAVSVLLPPTVSPGSLTFTDVGSTNAQTVNVSEPGYSGPFGFVSDTCTGSGIASLSAAGSGPSSTVTVTPLAGGSCSFSVQDTTHSLTSNPVSVTVGPFGAIVPTPTSLTFSDITPQSFTVSESGYTGNFTIDQSSCSGANIATVSPLSGNASTTFTVTPSITNPAGGSCNINVTDDHATAAGVVAVTVGPFGAISISPPTISLTVGPDPPPVPFTVAETGYTGIFTVYDSVCSGAGIARLNGGNTGTNFKVKGLGTVGNCAMVATDDHGGTGKLLIFATSGSITVSPGQTIQFAAGAPASQPITVSDTLATHFTATSSDPTGNIAAVAPPLSVSGAFTVTTQGTTGQASITIADDAGGQAVISVGVGMSPLIKKHKPVIHKPVPVASPTPRPHLHRPIVTHPGGSPSPRPSPLPTPSPQVFGQLTVSAQSVNLVAGGPPQQIMVSETGYGRRFDLVTSNAAVMRATTAANNGPVTSILVQPLSAGTATIRVTDDHGGVMTITVVVRAARPPTAHPFGHQGGA
ncbi:MAG: FecR domain-containing protein [Candidatus Eremiobacteraeota bacterium]|nr:FecR domain-containing protein [Candidatus Eremiobacteraeota bacterium]